MKRRYLAFFAAATLAFVFAGCKSTPEETPEDIPVEEIPGESGDYSEANLAIMEKLNAAREEALASGVAEKNPLAYAAAEVEYAAVLAASENPEIKLASSTGAIDLSYRYQALAAYVALSAKELEINQYELAPYAQSHYDNAVEIMELAASPDLSLVSGKQLLAKLQEADSDFNAVLIAGFRVLAKEVREGAVAEKQKADSVKAAVARKADYDKAVALITKGDSNFVTGSPRDAYFSYLDAKEMFSVLYTEISDARVQAQAKIDAAKARVAQAEAVAESADASTPIEGELAGIEAEDAKLLEDDDFSDSAEAAVIEELDESAVAEGEE